MFYEVEGGIKEVRVIKEIREIRKVKEISFTKFTNLLKFSKFSPPQHNLASEECRVQHSAKMAAMDST